MKSRILKLCEQNGVDVPAGFHRHAPSRYAVVINRSGAAKLSARTYFNRSDLAHYLDANVQDSPYRIIDFEDGVYLERASGNRFHGVGSIDA